MYCAQCECETEVAQEENGTVCTLCGLVLDTTTTIVQQAFYSEGGESHVVGRRITGVCSSEEAVLTGDRTEVLAT